MFFVFKGHHFIADKLFPIAHCQEHQW